MDMDEVLFALYEAAAPDEAGRAARLRAARGAEPCYARLREALGEARAEEIWAAAMELGGAEEQLAFRTGLRLGLRLMALSL